MSSVPPTPVSAFPPTVTSTPVQPPQQRLTAYPAYEKNGLRITLTPQTSPTRPGVVMILARFQVTGGEAVTGLSFQAAVPKVCLPFCH
jgi:AP-1 complex subunit gamma-1